MRDAPVSSSTGCFCIVALFTTMAERQACGATLVHRATRELPERLLRLSPTVVAGTPFRARYCRTRLMRIVQVRLFNRSTIGVYAVATGSSKQWKSRRLRCTCQVRIRASVPSAFPDRQRLDACGVTFRYLCAVQPVYFGLAVRLAPVGTHDNYGMPGNVCRLPTGSVAQPSLW